MFPLKPLGSERSSWEKMAAKIPVFPFPGPQGAPQPGSGAGGSRKGVKHLEGRPWALGSQCCCWHSCWGELN